MKRILCRIAFLFIFPALFFALFFTTPAIGQETETSAYATVDLFSNYVWRGQKLSESAVVQPAVGIGYGGFGLELWANYDTDTEEHNETDMTASYGFEWNQWSFEGGYVYYALDGYDDTQEVYFSLGYDILLKPAMTFYYDFDEGDGAFLELAIGHSFALPKDMALNLGASASVNFENEVMGLDEDGDPFTNFYNGEIKASLTIPLHEHFSIEPSVGYSFPISGKAEDAIESISYDEDSRIFYGGVNATLDF